MATPDGAVSVKQESSMDRQTMLAVLQFLKKNNLKGTEELLRKEACLSDDVKVGGTTEAESDVSQALAAYKSEGDPTLYEDHYVSLKQFVESSLDVHRCELSTVLYPVFVHMYLELVYNNHQPHATNFFEKFSVDQEEYYHNDLKQLSTVTLAEQMEGNQLLDNFKGSKFVIKMSRDSYNHLKRHLQEKKLHKLLNIIQEQLFVDVFDGVPRTKQQIDSTSGGMGGEARKEANKSKVYHGLLKEPEINIRFEEDEEEKEGDEASKPKKKKPKKDSMLNKKAKNDPNAPPVTRIPLPEMRDVEKIEKARSWREAAKRVALGPDNLPSICFYTFLNASHSLTSLEVCEDSSLISAGFGDSKIKIWTLTPNRLRTMKRVDELNLIDKESDDVLERMMDTKAGKESRVLSGHSGPVYSTSFTPDKNLCVSASEDGTVRLWGLQTWSNLVCYKGHNYPVWDVKFSPHGYYFASGSYDRTARLWSTDHHQPIRIFAGHLADVDSVQFHPNSNYVATGSTDRTVRLWDVLSGNCVRVMTGHKGPVHSLCFSPDGKYLASAGLDKMVLVWDLSNGELAAQLKGHTEPVHALCFNREGSVLASGGLDNVVRLWDTAKLWDDLSEDGVSTTINTREPDAYEMPSFSTKNSSVLHLHFTRRNVLLAGGPYGT